MQLVTHTVCLASCIALLTLPWYKISYDSLMSGKLWHSKHGKAWFIVHLVARVALG